MQLNNLLTKFKKKDSSQKEYFLAVELSDDVVKSAVWEVAEGQTQIVKTGPVKNWDGQDKEKLLGAVDESISAASESINPEPTGVIFGLPNSWTETDVINQDKKNYLKLICESLSLKPLGFVVTNTAVIKYLKIDEGTPVSAIFLQLNSTEINLSLVKLGKIIGAEIVGRSGDLGADVEEGLSRFKNVDVLPSRMILYDGKSDFEEDKQQLISYDWEEKLPFIHFPKVEALPAETSIKAISVAGGSEVAQSLGFEIKPTRTKTELVEPEGIKSNFGFGQQDAAEKVQPEPEPELEPELDLGLAATPKKLPKSEFVLNLIQTIKSKTKPVFLTFRAVRLNGLIIGLIGLLVIIFSAYWFLLKATVALTFEQKIVEENINVIFDAATTQVDLTSAILPAEAVTISVESSQSLPTTGTKLVGEAATGDITIYNKTSQAKKFAADTVLIGPNNLAFSLDEEVTVASRSSQENADGIITISPGKANAKISAKSIGTDSNLSTDSRLAFKQFSDDDYYAKTSGLSGGTSREVKAVAQKDQDDLLAVLIQELNNKVQLELQQKFGNNNQRFVEIEISDKLTQKNFNHNANEEADLLTLSAKLDYTTLSYNNNDLLKLINEGIKEKIPTDFHLSESNEIKVVSAAIKADKAAAKVSFRAKLIPKLNFEEIKKKIKGKYPRAIEDYFMALPGFANAEILIKPTFLPPILKTLPHITKNITLVIKSE